MIQKEMPFDLKYFFDFIKVIAIANIFCFHVFENYVSIFYATSIDKIISHGVFKFFFQGTSTITGYIGGLFETLFAFGSLGVEMFIIASGFGLYLSHLRKNEGWIVFYKKRILRIIPLYYIFLLVSALVYSYVLGYSGYLSIEGIKILLYHLLLIQTFNGSYEVYSLYYYISVIFLLYLTFPLLAKLIGTTQTRYTSLTLVCLAGFFAEDMLSLANIKFSGILFTTYIPYFCIGMLIAKSMFQGMMLHVQMFSLRTALFSALALLAMIYGTSYLFDYNKIYKLAIVLLTIMAVSGVFRFIQKLPFEGTIQVLASSSYVIYLSHLVLMRIAIFYFPQIINTRSILLWISYFTGIFVITMILSLITQKSYNSFLEAIAK